MREPPPPPNVASRSLTPARRPTAAPPPRHRRAASTYPWARVVEANFNGTGKWLLARITQAHADDTYNLEYTDDGGEEEDGEDKDDTEDGDGEDKDDSEYEDDSGGGRRLANDEDNEYKDDGSGDSGGDGGGKSRRTETRVKRERIRYKIDAKAAWCMTGAGGSGKWGECECGWCTFGQRHPASPVS